MMLPLSRWKLLLKRWRHPHFESKTGCYIFKQFAMSLDASGPQINHPLALHKAQSTHFQGSMGPLSFSKINHICHQLAWRGCCNHCAIYLIKKCIAACMSVLPPLPMLNLQEQKFQRWGWLSIKYQVTQSPGPTCCLEQSKPCNSKFVALYFPVCSLLLQSRNNHSFLYSLIHLIRLNINGYKYRSQTLIQFLTMMIIFIYFIY